LTMIIAAIAWARPRPKGMFLPGLLLVGVLAALPGNGSPRLLLDGAPAMSALTAPFFVAFAWAAALLVTALDGARHTQKPSAEVGAVLVGGALPWLLGAAAYALATLHDSPASRFLDLSEVACSRLSAVWLVPVTLLASIAAIFPLAAPAQSALRTSIYEVFPRAKKTTRVEAIVVLLALIAAIIARSDGGGNVFLAELGLAAFVAAAVTVAVLDFALVRRGKIYFDDLYSARGAYRGVFGFSPSGWVALFGGVAVFFATRFLGPNHLSATFAAATGGATWLLGQLVLGNIEHAIRERK
jgi:cytosine/uracil/thiamine/allantoin permease